MKLSELVPLEISIEDQIINLSLVRDTLSKQVSSISSQINILIESDKKRKVDYLLSNGWYLFTFKSLDIAGAEIYPYFADFLFRESVEIFSEFKNKTFSHYVEDRKEKESVVFSSMLKTSFKCEHFIAFEKWIESLDAGDYCVIEERFE